MKLNVKHSGRNRRKWNKRKERIMKGEKWGEFEESLKTAISEEMREEVKDEEEARETEQ